MSTELQQEWLSPVQIGQLLGLSRRHAHRLIVERMPHVQLGGRGSTIRVSRVAFDRWMAEEEMRRIVPESAEVTA